MQQVLFGVGKWAVVIDGWEAVMIGLIVILFLVWGPSRIPELAKGIGEAKREFDKVRKGEE